MKFDKLICNNIITVLKNESLRFNDISERIKSTVTTHRTLSRYLRELQKKGMVERTPDRLYQLTERGKIILEKSEIIDYLTDSHQLSSTNLVHVRGNDYIEVEKHAFPISYVLKSTSFNVFFKFIPFAEHRYGEHLFKKYNEIKKCYEKSEYRVLKDFPPKEIEKLIEQAKKDFRKSVDKWLKESIPDMDNMDNQTLEKAWKEAFPDPLKIAFVATIDTQALLEEIKTTKEGKERVTSTTRMISYAKPQT